MWAFECLEQIYHILEQRLDMELEFSALKYVSYQWISWYRATRVSSCTKLLHTQHRQLSSV